MYDAHRVPNGLTVQRAEDTVSGRHDNTVGAGVATLLAMREEEGAVAGTAAASCLPLLNPEWRNRPCSSLWEINPKLFYREPSRSPSMPSHTAPFSAPHQTLQGFTHMPYWYQLFSCNPPPNWIPFPIFLISVVSPLKTWLQSYHCQCPPCSPQPMAVPPQHLCLEYLVLQLCTCLSPVP